MSSRKTCLHKTCPPIRQFCDHSPPKVGLAINDAKDDCVLVYLIQNKLLKSVDDFVSDWNS